MKKTSSTLLILAVALIIVGIAFCGFAQLRGEKPLELFSKGNGFSWGLSFGEDQKNYTVCADGKEAFSTAEVLALDLSWVSGSVSVEPYDGKEIQIEESCSKSLNEEQRMRWQLKGGTLSVLYCANKVHSVPDKKLTVRVPRSWTAKDLTVDTTSAAVTLRDLTVEGETSIDTASGSVLLARLELGGTLDIDTMSGEVTVENCSCENLEIDTASGDVRLTGTELRGALDIDTMNGMVEAKDCVCDSVDVDTASGSVSLLGLPAGCEVSADTMSGKVTLAFSGRPGSIDADTASGDVTLRIPRGTKLALDFESSSGKLKGNYYASDDGVPVKVDTASGNLTIEED